MARRSKTHKIEEKDLTGFKHFKLLLPALSRLHKDGCRRDRAGNRILHFDQYISLLLLYQVAANRAADTMP